MRDLQEKKSETNANPALAEAFSIGLTLLDAGLLVDNSKLYNFKNTTFDEGAFKQVCSRWVQSNYSDFLQKVVLSMCELDPNQRKSPADILSTLAPYEDYIKNLREFTVPSNPPATNYYPSTQIKHN